MAHLSQKLKFWEGHSTLSRPHPDGRKTPPQCLKPCTFGACSLPLHRILNTPYISSPNHCLLFATHAHTNATCFAVILRLCYLIVVSLSTLLGTIFYVNATPIVISAKVPPYFLFLQAAGATFPCNILLYTQLLYSLPFIVNDAVGTIAYQYGYITDISILVSNGTNCQNLSHPIQIPASTAASICITQHVT